MACYLRDLFHYHALQILVFHVVFVHINVLGLRNLKIVPGKMDVYITRYIINAT